mgnify:CR=1 FL=1
MSENDKLSPMNPYAKSKLKLEKFIIKKSKIHKAKYIILRYFNVVGADYKKRTGMIAKASTNLFKVICEVATGKRKKLIIISLIKKVHRNYFILLTMKNALMAPAPQFEVCKNLPRSTNMFVKTGRAVNFYSPVNVTKIHQSQPE